MKSVIIVLALGLSLNVQAKQKRNVASAAAPNAICEAKAIEHAKKALLTDFSDSVISDASASLSSSKKDKNGTSSYSYVVSVNTGGKFDMNYNVSVDDSGPNACYLRSLSLIIN